MVVRVLDVPLYAGVAVTELGTGVAALVYGAGLLLVAAFGGPNGWPYGLVYPTVPVLDAGGVRADGARCFRKNL